MKFRNLAAAIAGMAFLAAASLAQTARLEGDVIGFDGKPLQGAVVKMHRTDILQDFKTVTDKKGHFIQMGLQPGGIFTISIEVDGKLADSQPGKATLVDPQPSWWSTWSCWPASRSSTGAPSARCSVGPCSPTSSSPASSSSSSSTTTPRPGSWPFSLPS